MDKQIAGIEDYEACEKRWRFPKIYKLSSKGEPLVWNCWVVKEIGTEYVTVYTQTGPVAGGKALKTHEKKVESVRGVDAYDRAVSANHTKYVNKLRTGYFSSVDAASTKTKPKMPMLAKDMHPDDIQSMTSDQFPIYMQIKLNGVRGTYFHEQGVIMSRNLKPYDKLELLKEACQDLAGADLDFEIYCVGKKINEIVSMVRHGDESLQAWIFDIPSDLPYRERCMQMAELAEDLKFCKHIKFVSTQVADNKEQVQKFYNDCVMAGAEGIILREIDGSYMWNNKSTRSSVLVKVKPTISAEFEVVDVECEERIIDGQTEQLVEFICNSAGGTFKVSAGSWPVAKRIKWYKGYRAGFWSAKSIGLMTVEFREWTSKMKPFHVIDAIVRDYE